MNIYERKQEARRQRYEEMAERAEARANAAYKRADMREEVSGIPFGQPILVGHHSEGRHRAAIKRADNAMRKSIEESNKAAYYADKAAGVGRAGISSDDPDAPEKMREKIAKAEALQEAMKARNAEWRKAGNKAGRQADGTWVEPPCPPYELTNNSANIRRMKDRLAQLERAAERETIEVSYQGGPKVIENADENRVQIVFDGKPDADTRQILKSNGFRWSPYNKAWQRHLNNAGRYAARCALKEMGVTE